MRTGGAFEAQTMPPHEHYQAAAHTAATATATGWKSPVPYLFGGLAAMLGLIAFALLILACSYWKLSGYTDSSAADADGGDGGAGEKPKEQAVKSVFLNTVLVIMPGEEKPTQVATPATSRASSFGEGSCSCGGGDGADGGAGKEEKEVELGRQNHNQGGGDDTTTTTAGGAHPC